MNQQQLFADISDYQTTFDARAYAIAGRTVIMIKTGEATSANGAVLAPARIEAAHANRLHVIHYLFAHLDVDPIAQLQAYLERARPLWHPGDRMELDIEDASGDPQAAIPWLTEAQRYLTQHEGAPRAIAYTNEAYLAEAGPQLANQADWWHIAAYDGLLLGRGTPHLPRHTHPNTRLLAKQYTNGQEGAQPHTAPGLGPCDNNILTPHGANYLKAPRPHLHRRHIPIRS
jgi:hypothetical protein